ncbi:hypothetical protein Tco_1326500 [Tanacetum coccineum]
MCTCDVPRWVIVAQSFENVESFFACSYTADHLICKVLNKKGSSTVVVFDNLYKTCFSVWDDIPLYNEFPHGSLAMSANHGGYYQMKEQPIPEFREENVSVILVIGLILMRVLKSAKMSEALFLLFFLSRMTTSNLSKRILRISLGLAFTFSERYFLA